MQGSFANGFFASKQGLGLSPLLQDFAQKVVNRMQLDRMSASCDVPFCTAVRDSVGPLSHLGLGKGGGGRRGWGRKPLSTLNHEE